MKKFLLAFSFLTILPVGPRTPVDEKDLARSMAYYPLVGLVIGLFLVIGHHLFSFFLPKALVLWFVIGLLCLLTRCLHLDGFADTIDGLACGGTREKILEVMRDSRIGAFGVIGLILLIGAKYLTLNHIPIRSLPYALVMMAVMGRSSIVLVCYRSAYARSEGGLARSFVEHLGVCQVIFSSASALLISILLMGIKGAGIFLGVSLFSFGYRLYFRRKLGGVTGDILGAANEIAEMICLLLLVIYEYLLRN